MTMIWSICSGTDMGGSVVMESVARMGRSVPAETVCIVRSIPAENAVCMGKTDITMGDGDRGMPEILHIIAHTDMTERARETAKRIFRILATAEAKAHGVSESEVHFHEVGAVDSIVDIISVAVCLDDLRVKECIVPVLCEGTGTVRCQHGILMYRCLRCSILCKSISWNFRSRISEERW